MPNPIMAWLRGDDLKVKDLETQVAALEQKLWLLPDVGAAIRAGTLVHGPFASQMIDAAYGRGGDGNSAVFACLSAICTAYPEAPLKVWQQTDEADRRWLRDSQLQQLLDHPNEFMSGPVLWYWTQYAKHINGNAYWRKIRSGDKLTGNVVQLWPISPLLVQPWRNKGSDNFIDSYKYQPKPGEQNAIYIEPENIVHFKLGMDDRDHRLGCAPLRRLVTEVMGDELASEWQAAMLQNGGAAGMVVEVPAESDMDEQTATVIKNDLSQRFGMGSQGKTAVLTGGAKMNQYGFSPDDMDMRTLHRLPEERIAAVLRVPAIIAGLGAGLDRSTYANFREAREMFAEMTILPLYGFDQAVVNTSLLPDFSNDRRVFTAFDITDLRALQEDEDAKYQRLNIGVQGRWVTPNEARADVGLPPMQGGDVVMQPNAPVALPPVAGKDRTISLKAGEVDADTLQALVDLSVPGFTEEFEKYLNGARLRVNRALVSGQ